MSESTWAPTGPDGGYEGSAPQRGPFISGKEWAEEMVKYRERQDAMWQEHRKRLRRKHAKDFVWFWITSILYMAFLISLWGAAVRFIHWAVR